MPTFFRRAGILLTQVAEKCARDNTAIHAAALSFYTMLSLAPATWVVVAAAGAFVGRQSAHEAVFGWMTTNFGPGASQYLDGILDQVNQASRAATIGGLVAMFLGATAAFNALQESLHRIWKLPEPPDRGVVGSIIDFLRNFFTRRALAFVIMLMLGTLLLASLLASSALGVIASYAPSWLPRPWLEAVDFFASVILMMGVFGALYHLLHKKAFAARDLWTGAAVTSVLFAIGKTLIAWYLGGAGLRSAYGAAGSLVLLLLWVYYSTQILLFGAVFTEVYARLRKTWKIA